MEYYFQDYVFKSDQLTLLKQGQLVKLRVNEAKLLALLLSDPDSVFSKNDIFSEVWAGKIVTEQVIFQNISRLRNIFENDSIINHPKKGYQWNIALAQPLNEVKPTANTPSVARDDSNSNRAKTYTTILLSLLLIFTCYLFYSTNKQSNYSNTKQPVLKLALMPINKTNINNNQTSVDSSAVYNMLENVSSNKTDILIKKVNEKLNYQQLRANLEFVLLDKLAEHQVDGLLLIDLSSKYGKRVLNFLVKAKGYFWRGELIADNLESLLTQLKQQLSYLSSMQLIQQGNITNKSINAKLVLLHQQYPNDVIILNNLINDYMNKGHANEALLLIVRLKKLAEQQSNLAYLRRAFILEASVYLQQNHEEKAQESLRLASNIFNGHTSPEDQIALLKVATYLAFQAHDYQKLKTLNLEIIQLAKSVNNYGLEFSQTLYLSILAQKFKNLKDRQKYLQQAEAIYAREFFVPDAQIQLDFYSYVIASAEKDEAEQIKKLQKILAITSKNKGINAFYKNEAQDILLRLYVEKEQFDQALGLFNFEDKLTAKEKYLLASIYHHWKKEAKAIHYAEQAYNDAIWSGELIISLDSALLLLELSKNKSNGNAIYQGVYVEYIREHYLNFWLSMNKQRLIKTKIEELLGLVEREK